MQLQQNLAALNQVVIIQYIAPSAKKNSYVFTSFVSPNPNPNVTSQVNQAIEANIVRPELPEEADRVEQLLVNISFLLINRTQSRHKDTQNTEQAHRTQTG